jgi:hypothetical protein
MTYDDCGIFLCQSAISISVGAADLLATCKAYGNGNGKGHMAPPLAEAYPKSQGLMA